MGGLSDKQHPWWQRGVVYQIYPRSYQDSDGDGVGDLAGIERRLDYIAALGVEAIWLSPIFPSPMADFGYDVSDYCDIEPLFGSLGDFGGSAWEWDEASGQYYLHAFLPQQPDLNWRNPALKAAMLDVLRFWLARGVDGFRIDVLWHIVKAEGLPDNPVNPDWHPGMNERDRVLQAHSTDQPEAHAIAAEMRAIADTYGAKTGQGRALIGEIFLPFDRLARW